MENKLYLYIMRHDIKDYDLATLPKYFSLIVNGVRRSGKSRLIDWMINQIYNKKPHNFDDCYLLSSTAKQQDDVFQFVDEKNIIDELSEERIGKIIKDQEAKMAEYKKDKKAFKNPPNTLIIIDDILSDKKGKSLWHSKPVSELFFKGRHMGCSIIVLTQYVKALSPLMRCNADVLFYFRDLREDNRKCVLNEYLSFSNDKNKQKEGEEIMTQITSERYTAMAVDRYKGQYSKDFNEYVFKIKSAEKYNNKKANFTKLKEPKKKDDKILRIPDELDYRLKDKIIVNEGLKEGDEASNVDDNYNLRILI